MRLPRPGTKSDLWGILFGTAAVAAAVAVLGANEPQAVTPPTIITTIQQAGPTPPWTLPTITPRPTHALYSQAPCGCSYDAYQCTDFREPSGALSQPGAQICFNYCMDQVGEDVHNLVIDNPDDAYVWDGFACKERTP